MTSVREVVEMPGMPGWVRLALALLGLAFVRLAVGFAQPLFESGWTWGHGVAVLVAGLIGLDVVHAAARKRWPLVLFTDLILVRLMTGRWR